MNENDDILESLNYELPFTENLIYDNKNLLKLIYVCFYIIIGNFYRKIAYHIKSRYRYLGKLIYYD